jgi:two-component system sensor histidine kinase VanS
MQSKKNTTKRRLSLYLYLTLFLYTVAGFGLILLLQYVYPKIDSIILSWIYWRADVILIFYLIIGFICIFHYFWNKPWGYLDEVISATKTVYEESDQPVELSDPLKESERQLNQIKMSVLLSRQAAKQAEDKKNELVMYLAHDIRTPLTTVIGYLSLLHEAPDMPEPQKEKYVKVALDKANRLEKLLNELFEITKYNAHTVSLKKETVDLHCLLAQVVDEIYPSLSANGNTITVTADDDLSVNADPEKLARVFSNLLKNAAAYSYPKTEITITEKKQGDCVRIVFENHGKTIQPEQLAGIFEKFNRLDEARLSDTGGAGLGLSIAEEIIHLHGGTITAASENERISFVVMLPVSA